MKSGKCSVQIIGRIQRAENLQEPGKIIEVLEGFKSTHEARKAGAAALKKNPLADTYKVIPAY